MTFKTAHAFARSLAASLLVSIVVIHTEDGQYSVMELADYDGDTAAIAVEIDPFV